MALLRMAAAASNVLIERLRFAKLVGCSLQHPAMRETRRARAEGNAAAAGGLRTHPELPKLTIGAKP